MTEKEYILNFLNKNYEVITLSHGFSVFIKAETQTQGISTLKLFLENLFGPSSFKIIDEWYLNRCKQLTKSIRDYIEGIDFSKDNTLIILNEFLLNFISIDFIYHEQFLKDMFYDYHIEHNILPKIKGMRDRITTSADILAIVNDYTITEPGPVITYLNNHLNKWYTDYVLEDKLNFLFKQFEVSVGPRNWEVKWGKHEVTKKLILDYLKDESSTQQHIALEIFSEWYKGEIEFQSEKEITKYFGN